MVSLTNRKLEAFLKSAYHNLRIILLELVILTLIILLANSGLLDVKVAISVVMTEVAIGIVLYYLLGEKRRSYEEEIVNLMDAVAKFQHTKAYTFSVFPEPFEYVFYYIENTKTCQCYKAPKYLEELIDRGVITKVKCKNEAEMKELLNQNGIHLNDCEPLFTELLVPFGKGKRQ
jgi:hypothetical protein